MREARGSFGSSVVIVFPQWPERFARAEDAHLERRDRAPGDGGDFGILEPFAELEEDDLAADRVERFEAALEAIGPFVRVGVLAGGRRFERGVVGDLPCVAPAVLALQRAAAIDQDAEQPRPEDVLFLVAVHALVRAHESLLDHVFGVRIVPEQPPGQPVTRDVVPCDQLLEGPLLTRFRSDDQLGVRHSRSRTPEGGERSRGKVDGGMDGGLMANHIEALKVMRPTGGLDALRPNNVA